jgi:transcriptional regulator
MAGSDVFTGTLELLILRSLQGGEQHGYAIGRWIRETSGDVLQIEEGALYPALHRLARRKLVAARWVKSESGQRVREYRLTDSGRQQLIVERDRWALISDVMARLLASPLEGEA